MGFESQSDVGGDTSGSQQQHWEEGDMQTENNYYDPGHHRQRIVSIFKGKP